MTFQRKIKMALHLLHILFREFQGTLRKLLDPVVGEALIEPFTILKCVIGQYENVPRKFKRIKFIFSSIFEFSPKMILKGRFSP